MKKIAFMLIHDFVAHPLIGLTGGSSWAWRLHDLVGEVATYGSYGPGVHLTGKASSVADVVSALSQRGWQVIDDHIHGSDGRGQALLEPPAAPPTVPGEPECEGWAASWCPRCGDCSCSMDERERGEHRRDCPLHGLDSKHAHDEPAPFAAPPTVPGESHGDRRYDVGPGFIRARECPDCKHTRCGKDCDCDCDAAFARADASVNPLGRYADFTEQQCREALAGISGVLCDSGVVVPSDPREYARALRTALERAGGHPSETCPACGIEVGQMHVAGCAYERVRQDYEQAPLPTDPGEHLALTYDDVEPRMVEVRRSEHGTLVWTSRSGNDAVLDHNKITWVKRKDSP